MEILLTMSRRTAVLVFLAFVFLMPTSSYAVGGSTASTQLATSTTSSRATLNGTINGLIGGNATVRGFAYGTSTTLTGANVSTTTENGSFVAGPYTASVSGLTLGTFYYARAYATNPNGTFFGNIIRFRTAALIAQPPNNLGLVGYWPMDEATSTIAGDFSGNGNNGTMNTFANPPTASSGWNPGKRGAALAFDGSSDYISVPTISISSDMTVSAWVKLNSNSVGDWSRTVIAKSAWGAGADGDFYLNLRTSPIAQTGTGRWTFSLQQGGTTYNAQQASDAVVGVWTHVVGIKSGNNTYVYVNGVQAGTDPSSGSFANNSNTIDIGAFPANEATTALNGTIDDVRLYNRALTESEITTLYEKGAGRNIASSQTLQRGSNLASGLMGHWTFDGPDFTTIVADVSGNNNNGYVNLVATSTAKTNGKLGQALNLDGSTSFVKVADNSTLDMTGSSVTQAAWVYWNGTTAQPAQKIFSKQGSSNPWTGQYLLQLGNGGGEGMVVTQIGTNTTIVGVTRIATSTWAHVASVHDAAADTTVIYVNGAVDQTSTGQTTTITNQDGPLDIGRGDPFANAQFNGAIDDARLYNRALSADEIKQLYNLGRTTIRQ